MPESSSPRDTFPGDTAAVMQFDADPVSLNALLSRSRRYRLLTRARWLFLALATLYSATAALVYTFSTFGWFLSPLQFYGLLLVLVTILGYNTLYEFAPERMAAHPLGDHLQLLLDYLCVALLSYFTGGAASWFWAVTLLVTLEATILLDKRLQVLVSGLLGALCYGLVLGGQYFDLLPFFSMPFIDPELHHHGLYLLLLWCWVLLLNAIVAVAGAYLMAVLRREHGRVRVAETRLRSFLEQANDLIFSLNPRGDLLYGNQVWRQTLGYSAEEVCGLNVSAIIDPAMRGKCLLALGKALNGEQVEPLEGRFISSRGDVIDVEGTITCSSADRESGVLWLICRDVTARKRTQEQLYQMAHHDLLTGLPNRMFFADRLQQALALAKRQQLQCAVLYLDLDRFKIINDTMGHAAGDQLLQEAARRLRNCVRETDTVARLGGDEFAVVLGSLRGIRDVELVVNKILATFAKPATIDTQELFITTSIGGSLSPQHGEEATLLLKRADVAMYQAKALGRNNFQLYDEAMDLDADRRMLLERGLRKALEHEEFRILYQPKVDAETGRITAVEALIRWEHPELGLLAPVDFISLAEETGLIVPIGEWVMRKACLQNRQWQEEGLSPVRVAVNLSGFQLQQRNLLESVRQILDETGLAPEYLEFEITETVIMQNPESTVAILASLRDLGMHISIDDFGTGYSSLAHLKRFSINTLKIDQTFVRDIEISSANAAIATAIITMGNSLNLKVIAEGVETAGQFAMLKDRQCAEMQGYLFSRPLVAGEMAEFLRAGNASLPSGKNLP